MGKNLTIRHNTVGELMDWIKENNIPPETNLVFLVELPEMFGLGSVEYHKCEDCAGDLLLMV